MSHTPIIIDDCIAEIQGEGVEGSGYLKETKDEYDRLKRWHDAFVPGTPEEVVQKEAVHDAMHETENEIAAICGQIKDRRDALRELP